MDTKKEPGKSQYEEWHDDPANWKLGIFYFNPKDKRLFPPKRIKWAGWTINFANPFSILAFVLLIIAFIMLLQRLQTR